MDLSSSGEHKPAVDAAREAEVSGVNCSPEILASVQRSRSILHKADSYVHKAVKRRKEGNLLSARANLDKALEIYPKYYWVQTLRRNVDRSIQAELDSLRHETSYFEARDDPERALSRIRDAMKLSPGDRELDAEAARLERVIVEKAARIDAQERLDNARAHLDAGRYEEAQRLLMEGDVQNQLGARGEELLAEIDMLRKERVNKRFNHAIEKEKSGDLYAAAGHTMYVLDLSRPSDDLSEDIVNFARLLGMKFYSAGELSRAKELWAGALGLAPGNKKLLTYLKEVDTRLDNLDRIKRGGIGDEGN